MNLHLSKHITKTRSVVKRTVLVPVLKDLVLIPVRTTPWDSKKELDELYEVFLAVKDKWKTDVSCMVNLKVMPNNHISKEL